MNDWLLMLFYIAVFVIVMGMFAGVIISAKKKRKKK